MEEALEMKNERLIVEMLSTMTDESISRMLDQIQQEKDRRDNRARAMAWDRVRTAIREYLEVYGAISVRTPYEGMNFTNHCNMDTIGEIYEDEYC